jgi:hypothetical protein
MILDMYLSYLSVGFKIGLSSAFQVYFATTYIAILCLQYRYEPMAKSQAGMEGGRFWARIVGRTCTVRRPNQTGAPPLFSIYVTMLYIIDIRM